MSNDINPTRSPTLTDLLQGGEDKTEQAGFNLAEFRLKSFNQMIQHASAYQVVLMTEGSITQEECTSTVQGYAHIQTQLIEADSSFCCEDCLQGSPYLFSNDDGLCAWCCVARSEELNSGADPENDDDEQLQLDDYQDHLKHFGEGYCPTNEEVLAVMQEIEDEKIGHLPAGVHNCCDWHSQAESTKEQPCATHQGGSNYAPNFGEEIQGEGEYDFENALFLSHVEHLIKDSHILEILQGWVDIDCPSCSNKIDFETDGGNGCRADCFHCEVGCSLNVVMS